MWLSLPNQLNKVNHLIYTPGMGKRPATAEEARALANPLRLRILRQCLDRAMTNEELAARLDRDAGTVLHHVRILVAAGFLAPDEERRGARGAIERPYRSTGKSWTLDVGDAETGMLAMVDAFRAELTEITAEDIFTLSRLAVRLQPQARDAFAQRIAEIVTDLHDADDPEGEPYGMLVGLHRLGTAPARRGPGRRASPRAPAAS
jgi:DNA-binding transcriptional ArsR family regulator